MSFRSTLEMGSINTRFSETRVNLNLAYMNVAFDASCCLLYDVDSVTRKKITKCP